MGQLAPRYFWEGHGYPKPHPSTPLCTPLDTPIDTPLDTPMSHISIKPRLHQDTCSRLQVSRTSNLYPDRSGYNLYPGYVYPGVNAA